MEVKIVQANSLNKIVINSSVALVLMFGALVTNAGAQRVVVRPSHQRVVVVRRPFFPRFNHGYYPGYYTVVDPIAYQREQGYSDGLSRGKSDAKHGKANDPRSHKHFLNSDSESYREAFLHGYDDGFAERG